MFEKKAARTAEMIAPFVKQDPTAFCSYEDHLTAVDTIMKFCMLRAESVRGAAGRQNPVHDSWTEG